MVLLFFTKPLQYMPTAVLASVVFLIGIELVDIAGMHKILRRPARRVRRCDADGTSSWCASASSRPSSSPSSCRSSITSAGATARTTGS